MSDKPKNPLQEIVQPFVDVINAPRALWGINLAYVLEGMVYFGMLGYLAIYCSEFIFQAIDGSDEAAGYMAMVLTAGITIAMFFLGVVADKKGVRFALVAAFCLMLLGRAVWSGAPNLLGLEPTRPGVVAGDQVSLYVSEVDDRYGVRTITESTLIGSKTDAVAPELDFALDLAIGEGISPSKALESRLVSLSSATVMEGEDAVWTIQYGSKPVEAKLFAHAADTLGLCPGSVVSLKSAYISTIKNDSTEDGADPFEYVIRTNWSDDFAVVDKSDCAEGEGVPASSDNFGEEEYIAKERWAVVSPTAEMQQAEKISLTALRALDNGKTGGAVLDDVYVTYVRNGGYFVQAEKDGPAVFVFVSPFWSPLQIMTMVGMLLVVIGYGMYQPAAYAGVRKFTTPKTAAMGFAMLYALMNLGGWLPTFAFLLRGEEYANLGIRGTFWVYTFFTAVALVATLMILNRRTIREAETTAKEETDRINAEEEAKKKEEGKQEDEVDPELAEESQVRIKPHMLLFWLGAMVLIVFKGESPWYYSIEDSPGRWIAFGAVAVLPLAVFCVPWLRNLVAKHPLEDPKFAFFIFALIPVQTLFTYNWLILPLYIDRAFTGFIGEYFEIAANANPILIFIAVPLITAFTQKAKVYNMMIYGTFIMAAPAFLLVIGPYWWTLLLYLLIMTIGEAMWQPRFLQYAAEIAPEGRTGEYMGVAQLPWFLTKFLVPLLYSGRMMDMYCPAEGVRNTNMMWLIFACIAMVSPILLILAKGWVGKNFKTSAT